VSAPSLLSFVDAPVVVGDPDGRAAYVNPAFESRFAVQAQSVTGQPLANLFEGGVREAVLGAVAEVCEQGTTVRFRVRQSSVGYAAVASPIVAEDARVGVVILLIETTDKEERLLSLQREIQQPLDEFVRVFDELLAQSGGKGDEKQRTLVEDGVRALSRIRKWSEELQNLLGGRRVGPKRTLRFDPGRVVGEVTERMNDEIAAAGVGFQIQVPPGLPRVAGDGARLALALEHLLRHRLSAGGTLKSLRVAVRTLSRQNKSSLVIGVIDLHGGAVSPTADPLEPELELLRQVIDEFGGDLRVTSDPETGRTTAIRLDALKE
jgi:nitrogen-specific signal transduction histidine kinase